MALKGSIFGTRATFLVQVCNFRKKMPLNRLPLAEFQQNCNFLKFVNPYNLLLGEGVLGEIDGR